MCSARQYLRNKKPDYCPEKVRALLGKRGQLTQKSMAELSYWEFALIGFYDVEKQKDWMKLYSNYLKDHRQFMRQMNIKEETKFIDNIIGDLEYRKRLISL